MVKLIICAVVKNAAKRLKMNMDLAIKTGGGFEEYKLVVYENNSTDETKNILKNYRKPQIKIISEDISLEQIKSQSKIWSYEEVTGSNHPCRIEQIAKARNKVLDEINKEEYSHFDYVLWVDLDSKGWEIESVLSTFKNKDLWDVVYANSNPYYDTYALRTEDSFLGPEVVGEFWWQTVPTYKFSLLKYFKLKAIKILNNLGFLRRINLDEETVRKRYVKVQSAFNGIGIFRKELLKDCRYDFQLNEELKDFYRGMVRTKEYLKLRKIIEKDCSKFPGGEKDEQSKIIWKNNSGYKGPVVCEHVCLNLSLINKGYRIFMDKNLIYYDGGR